MYLGFKFPRDACACGRDKDARRSQCITCYAPIKKEKERFREKLRDRTEYYRANREHFRKLRAAWNLANPHKAAEYQKRARSKDPEIYRSKTRAWRAKNADKVKAWKRPSPERERERARQKRAEDPEKARAYQRAWCAQNPEKARARYHKHKARKLIASGNATADQIKARLQYYGYKCAYCGGDYEHLDHVVPLSRGGSNWPANMRPACASCNTSKGIKLLKEWSSGYRSISR